MAIDQRQKISPPTANDVKSLKDFASVTQQAFDDIFDLAHSHQIRTSAPTQSEGNVGDIAIVVISSVGYLYVKLPVLGWKRTTLS